VTSRPAQNVDEVVGAYNREYNLQTRTLAGRGWLLDTLRLVERLNNRFTLNEMYGFVPELQRRHPENHHVHDKIRQQLQFLRDKGIIEFVSRGVYRRRI
jgi:type II restriction enzyme